MRRRSRAYRAPKRLRIRAAHLLAAVSAAALLAGCGGEDGPPAPPPPPPAQEPPVEQGPEEGGAGAARQPDRERPSDERLIRDAIEAVLSEPDADLACREAMSERFVRTAYGNLAGCLAGRPRGSLATGSEISEVEVAGDRAEAVARPSGGVYDGVELEVELVRDGRRWLVDELRADVPVGP